MMHVKKRRYKLVSVFCMFVFVCLFLFFCFVVVFFVANDVSYSFINFDIHRQDRPELLETQTHMNPQPQPRRTYTANLRGSASVEYHRKISSTLVTVEWSVLDLKKYLTYNKIMNSKA